MNEPTSSELREAWLRAKKAADDREADYNRLNPLRRGDDSAEIRSEGAWFEIDRLRLIEEKAEQRYKSSLEQQ